MVYNEITVKEQEKAVFTEIDWIKRIKVRKDNDYKLLEELVDMGEAEAIISAKQLTLPLLADDAKARKYAHMLNVEVLGTLGLLKLAKNRKVIPSVKEVIIDMLAKGYYIDNRLIAKLLESVDESY